MMVLLAPVSSSRVAEFPFTLASIRINECTERNGKRTLSVRAQLGEESRVSAISITTEVLHRSVKEAVRIFTGRDPLSSHSQLSYAMALLSIKSEPLRNTRYPAAVIKFPIAPLRGPAIARLLALSTFCLLASASTKAKSADQCGSHA